MSCLLFGQVIEITKLGTIEAFVIYLDDPRFSKDDDTIYTVKRLWLSCFHSRRNLDRILIANLNLTAIIIHRIRDGENKLLTNKAI